MARDHPTRFPFPVLALPVSPCSFEWVHLSPYINWGEVSFCRNPLPKTTSAHLPVLPAQTSAREDARFCSRPARAHPLQSNSSAGDQARRSEFHAWIARICANLPPKLVRTRLVCAVNRRV